MSVYFFRSRKQSPLGKRIFNRSFASVKLIANGAQYDVVFTRDATCTGGAYTSASQGLVPASGFFVLWTTSGAVATYGLIIYKPDGTSLSMTANLQTALTGVVSSTINVYARGTPTASAFEGQVYNWIYATAVFITPTILTHVPTVDYGYFDYRKFF